MTGMPTDARLHVVRWVAGAAALAAALWATQAAARFVNESLLITEPNGYKVGFDAHRNNMVMHELVPDNQTANNWTEMLTVQVFYGTRIDPVKFEADMEKRWSAHCPNATSQKISTATDNNYPAMLWQLACPSNPSTGKPELTWFKAIEGNDNFYLVQKAFKFEPSKQQLDDWLNYLRSVRVCDTRLSDRQCPAD